MVDTLFSSKLLLFFAVFSILFILYSIILYSYFNYSTIYINIGIIGCVLYLLYYVATFNGLPTKICNKVYKQYELRDKIAMGFIGLVCICYLLVLTFYVFRDEINSINLVISYSILFLILASIFISYGCLMNIIYVSMKPNNREEDTDNKKENLEIATIGILLLSMAYLYNKNSVQK